MITTGGSLGLAEGIIDDTRHMKVILEEAKYILEKNVQQVES